MMEYSGRILKGKWLRSLAPMPSGTSHTTDQTELTTLNFNITRVGISRNARCAVWC